jgi:hypothetical protein
MKVKPINFEVSTRNFRVSIRNFLIKPTKKQARRFRLTCKTGKAQSGADAHASVRENQEKSRNGRRDSNQVGQSAVGCGKIKKTAPE